MLLVRSSFSLPRAALLLALVGACHEPPGASATLPSSAQQSAASVAPAPSATSADSCPTRTGSGSDAGSSAAPSASSTPDAGKPAAGNEPAHANPEGEASLALVDAQGQPLPQTNERPSTSSAAFQRRIGAVAAAIISGDPEPALASFFPVLAYAQVKDVAKPERDYKFRLVANFKRDVLEYHRALGADAAQATFTGITVPEASAKWMEPGSEGNKLGYYRVLRSRLHFTLPAGKARDFELTSLISWRGEWYVVHLHGFK